MPRTQNHGVDVSVARKWGVPQISLPLLIMAIVPLWCLWRRKRGAANEAKTRKWKVELKGRVPEEELEMAGLGAESEVGRDVLGRSEMGSEFNLNGVPNTLPTEGDEERESEGERY